MKKYYQLAIDLDNSSAMNNLGHYYHIEKNYEEMKKYYLMAIELGNSNAMYNLGDYYKTIEKNYELMKKYYLIANIEQSKNALKKYYSNNMTENISDLFTLYSKNILLQNEIENLKKKIVELEFTPGNIGYQETKSHFENVVHEINLEK